MMKILGIVYCLNSALYMLSNDCPASKAGFNIREVPEYVCGDEQAKTYYAKDTVQLFLNKSESQFTIIKSHCLVP
jgi:hypothetical protein